jgi:hypothetical protein
MANHVTSNINFYEINDAAKAKVKELFTRLRTEGSHQWFGDLFVGEEVNEEGGVLTYEQSEKYSWTTSFVGPKWCYIEDYDDGEYSVYINTESAWSPPTDGLERLLDILVEYDPNIIATITYTDEGLGFAGWYVYQGNEVVDGLEDDYDEIMSAILSDDDYNHLAEHWDWDESDWKTDEDGEMSEETEEARDEMWEIQWEYVYNYMDEQMTECLNHMESEKENA